MSRDPEGWAAYYAKTGARPPRPSLLFALDRFADDENERDHLAVDLGSGGGRDVIELLRRGWNVIAIDAEEASAAALQSRADLPNGAMLETRVATFEEAVWPQCSLVNSSFALPLCAPESFGAVWEKISESLKEGGRFAGQLYGMRDSWVGRPGMTFHSRAEIDALLTGFEVEMLDEEEDDSVTPRGETKHWHVFHIVARRRPA